MKQILIVLTIILSISLAFASELFIANQNDAALSRVNLNTFEVKIDFAELGRRPNQIVLHEDNLFVVDSLDDDVRVMCSITR